MSANEPKDSKNKSIQTKIKRRYKNFKKNRELKKRRKERLQAERSYEEKLNQSGRTTKSRKKQHDTYHKWGKRLIIANIIVFVLLIIAVWMVFYL
ncbi:MAG: hypothetical protein Q4F26_03675 [Atopococcus tabaci]|uniref:Uncharacterized protein n=1 Tax=Atopococcus tabaci TaxID=269774 RepID=A0AA43UCH6_9LACT|nr:hypothetical protein [Atopococcus tabaci]